MIGQTISHYHILEKLGEGGMGIVYKAQDTKLNRIVALKFLPDRVQKDADAKARFLQEAQAAAGLNHPNICTIHGVEEVDGSLFMVMEYIEGGTLREKIPFKKTDDAITIAAQIGEALQEAHAKGIVHRDIKADNIMLTAKGQAKVMDFGLAKLKGALKLTRTSSTVGTLGYMAPEQIQGGEVDHRSDIFSFGVLLFEMLTRKLPFRGEHEAAMMYSILNEPPEPIQSFLPEASAELAHILTRALEKDPEDRYQSMADMVSELRRLLKQTSRISKVSIPAMPAAPAPSSDSMPSSQPTPPPATTKNKNMLLYAGIAVIAVAAVAGTIMFTAGPSIELNSDMTLRVLDIPIADIDYPGLSGDGNWITVASNSGGVARLYLMNTAGGEPRAILTDTGGVYQHADLSFDASKITYTSLVSPRVPGIYVMSALGSGARLLAEGAALPRWQPDGSRIFFLSVKLIPGARFDIRSITPEGTDERLELEDAMGVTVGEQGRFSLSVSPDGRSIAYIRNFMPEKYQEVMVIDRKTKEIRQLTNDKKNVDEVCWASNGQILYSSNRTGNINLWMVPAEGGEPVQITKGSGPDLGIRISSDNSKLLYYVREEVGNLWIGSLESGLSRQMTTDEQVRTGAVLSPDGRRLAYTMANSDPLKPKQAIYVSDRDGSNRQEITAPGVANVFSAVWSMDGKRLVYAMQERQDSTQTNYTYLADVGRPGTPKRIAQGNPFMWLDDDRILLIDSLRTFIATISSGRSVQIFEDSTVGFPVRGGTHFFYRDNHGDGNGRYLVRVDAQFNRVGEPQKIMDILPYGASPDRDYIVYLGKDALWRVDLPSGRRTKIRNTFSGLNPRSSFTINPSTHEIVYSVNRSRAKLVMIENPFK